MMIEISIPVKALPLNMIYSQTKTGRRVKSKKYVSFKKEVLSFLPFHGSKFREFKQTFKPKKHFIRCNWTFKHEILTKENRISLNSGDTSNMIKPIEDIIFEYMGVNDAFVQGGTFDKFNSDKPEILFRAEIYSMERI